jgi:hypothetical protein
VRRPAASLVGGIETRRLAESARYLKWKPSYKTCVRWAAGDRDLQRSRLGLGGLLATLTLVTVHLALPQSWVNPQVHWCK